ncbi:MAG TPA: hypothetical protein VFS20_13285 [Longimicrobium sp.]|nr:hypothetical protein [Longimicrobium sp.]
MKIPCPECRVPVAADDVNLSTGLAKCRTCNSVFRFDNHPELAAPARRRAPVLKPEHVEVYEGYGDITIRYRWFGPKYIFFAVFCLIWNGFLLFWYTMAWAAGSTIMMLFPILHVAAGVFLTYTTFAGFFNSTTVALDGSQLSVRHGPLPWPGNLTLSTLEVQQLYCEEKISRGKNGLTYTYNLLALLHNGGRKKIVSGLDAPELPLWLEQHAEAWMKIRDEAVVGEFAGNPARG